MSKKQSVSDWIQRKKELEEKIKSLAISLGIIPNGHQKSLQATATRTRMESFLYNHGGNEDRLSEMDKQEYKQMGSDYETKRKAAITATKKYNAMKQKLAAVKLQLAELEFPISVESFSVDGAEPFVRNAVQPFLDQIQSDLKKLEQLKKKHAELDAELIKCKPKEGWMVEKDLVTVDVRAHVETVHERERVDRKKRTVSELIERTGAAISAKENQIDELRKSFSDALTTAINEYSATGKKTMAASLDEMVSTDNQYYASITNICNTLIAEAGARPVDVFHYTGGTVPAETRILTVGKLRTSVLNFIESVHSP